MSDMTGVFRECLEDALAIYNQTPQLGAANALKATILYIEALNFPGNLSNPLLALHMALKDAERGAKNPLLEVRKLSNAPPLTIVEKQARAHAAAALELLILSGEPRQQAALTVGRAAKNWQWTKTKNVKASTVLKWREHAMSGLEGDDFDTTTYNMLVNFAEPLPPDTKKSIVSYMLENPSWMQSDTNPNK